MEVCRHDFFADVKDPKTFVSRGFDYIILLTIFANCIALAVVTPYPNGDSNYTNSILVGILAP